MYPEDRVLVAVLKRRRDLAAARAGWYRIPVWRMPRGVHADYIAFFCSGSLRLGRGAVRFYACLRGVELAYRQDLLPDEPHHPRAKEMYYRLALGALIDKTPPIRNTKKQIITFIYTTWDRFTAATKISELYAPAGEFVDRSYYALNDARLMPALDDSFLSRPDWY